ncbi:MAG TPA: cytochrome c biogenesis protein CcdA [Saprospiraceae bacterium]|nr:cytochrome c biogenesis protein CcdA [Saprospiraceae bacterium]
MKSGLIFNRFLYLTIIQGFTVFCLSAQVLEPVKWKFSSKWVEGNTYELIFTADIAKSWSVYSQFTGDDGPVPTEITYEKTENVELKGESIEDGSRNEGYDKLFDTHVIKFSSDQPYIIRQKVKINAEKGIIEGYLTFMTCDDTKCLPPTDVDFSFTLKGNSQNESSASMVEKDPVTITEIASLSEGAENKTPEITLNLSLTEQTNFPAPGKMLDPVQWTYKFEKNNDTNAVIKFIAVMEKGWTVYSQFTDDKGPVPTELVIEKLEDAELEGPSIENGRKKAGLDPYFKVQVIKFLHHEPYTLQQNIKITGPNPRVSGYVTYMTCNDETCLPPTDIEFDLLLNEDSPSQNVATLLYAGKIENSAEGKTIDQTIPTILDSYKEPISDCEESSKENSGFLWIFIFGFAGGLLALMTPCVFPMIPITVSYFTKDTKRNGWTNGVIYGASIIVIYVALGLLITILLGPEALNRLSTNWIANTFFFFIFIAFAFSFFGYYEITLPSTWTTKSDSMADKGGLIGIFFMAFTLALVSFSCTGPIIGTAIVQAASKGEYIGPFIVMFGFSLALALPFGLFAAFPAWLNSLPRSGSWMNSVKVTLGFLELALALKFLSVADMTNHWGFLRYELFMGLWILIFLGLTLYLFGWIRFPHDSPTKKLSLTRGAFATFFLVFTLYLSKGFFINQNTGSYNTLTLMSGLAPPGHYNFFLPPQDLDPAIKEKYPSYSKCANNIDCFKDYYEGLAYAKEVRKPVLLDFTGYGCVNCRKTEEHIWVEEKIRSALNKDVVLVSLYVDDDEKLEEILISKSRGKKIRNIGNKWADFQIVNFEQNSQPLYVLMTPDEKVISAPRPFKEGIESYYKFLECGLTSFKSNSTTN